MIINSEIFSLGFMYRLNEQNYIILYLPKTVKQFKKCMMDLKVGFHI